MTSNMVVAMRDVVQMCFVGFSIQIEGAALAESVALFTHYQAAQLSEFCQPGRGTHTMAESVMLFTHYQAAQLQNFVSLVEEHTQE